MNRTIAESAFWGGARAFDDGDSQACEDFLALAVSAWPEIVSWGPWRRFRWKRRIGRAACRWIEPIASSAGFALKSRA